MRKILSLFVFCLLTVACSDEQIVVDNGINPGSLTPGTVLFTLDGVEYRAPQGTVTAKDNRNDSELEVLVLDGVRLFALELENFNGVAEYSITPSVNSILFRYDDSGTSTYDSDEGSGRVNITQYSTAGTAGTFEAVLINRTDATDTLRITDGAFNVEF